MDAKYDDVYAALQTRHWWWRAREAFLVDQLRLHGLCDGRRILDAGCAGGAFFPALSKCGEVEGLEPDPVLRDQAGRWRDRIHAGPLDDTFQPGYRYGLILLLDVLEHIEDPVPVLRRAIDLLEPDGVVVVTVPALQSLWTRHDELNEHYLRYDRVSFSRLAAAAGLHVIAMRYFFHWLALPKLGVRMLERVLPGPARPPRLPPAPLNHALYALSRLEQALTRRILVPWGSSLLVVGRRRAGDGSP